LRVNRPWGPERGHGYMSDCNADGNGTTQLRNRRSPNDCRWACESRGQRRPNIAAEATDQKVGGSNPSERASERATDRAVARGNAAAVVLSEPRRMKRLTTRVRCWGTHTVGPVGGRLAGEAIHPI
jgi:hypothetical protein